MSPSPMSPPPSAPDTKNLAIAIALSLAILLGFQYFYEIPREKARQAEMAQKREAQAAAQKTAPAQQAVTPAQAAASAGQPVSRPDALGLSQRISIDADAVSGTVSTLGGRFDDLVLKRYQDTIKKDSKAVTLLHPQGTADGYYAFFGFTAPDGSAGALPGPNTIWQAKAGEKLTPATPITLTYENGQGLTFKRVVKVDKNYLFTVTDTVVNAGAAPVTLQPYGAIRRHSKTKELPDPVNHQGMVGMFDNKLKKMTYQKLEKGEALQQASLGGWLGFTDKYWLAALIPDQKARIEGAFKVTQLPNEEVFESSYLVAPVALGVGQSLTTTQHLYAGSKRVSELRALGEQLGLHEFADGVDWGILWFLTKPFYAMLMFFNGLVANNIGVAILIVTVVIKIVTFPLVYTSYKSFAKLRDLAPKMAEIKERFAADVQRQQQETMKLYQTEKINPVAGCIPALLQMPIFFALFKVLSISLELRHAPFYGWIPDLSAKDPTTVFNLFGLLPYDPTALPLIGTFLAIGAWPILYGVSFWLLQKMQPTATDPMQAQIFALMPWIFVFVFAGFGSGLVIYYTWSNLLTIVQQYVIAKRSGTSNPIDEFFAKLGKKKTA
ncbi:membrane protein insertase YidC [Aquidulcibacter sp.]|uniref:membrane protein insertase YidC n=1 Tax=Aquidulcibacter sp. TaxID=2052990 RepID=UPI0037BEAF6B